ncbi:hypothetical protein FOXG_19465 [Fusarium oxysporum f. sp. lycopersici 4287]|uniref:Uncharacterized protein n=1 Tax=Fusarium oxysporum f. sp. lycopersici (strain 4287 / CBS 123668 / FGSC 9935 / NRRL 34936) TaxID=426428 RepID=A0A0J9WM58_FUSO4|nr:hypothetical protein FOXG_19465 [Fusarium oxysporum f. sp. lycopersici 4287]KNB04957.1 hypothetical protein FOXG_19465 [Fusarium oxysporum f. sp. lycopersici 4287]
MSQQESGCLMLLDYTRDRVLDFNSDLDLKNICSRMRSLSIEADVVRGWKSTIKAIESGIGCGSLIQNLHSYLKFLFGNEKGNRKRQYVIDKLKEFDFNLTVLVGLSCPEAKDIDIIFSHKTIRNGILQKMITRVSGNPDWQSGLNQLQGLAETEPRTNRKHGRDDGEQVKPEFAERPLRQRPEPSHGHGCSISENNQRLTQSEDVEKHNDKPNNKNDREIDKQSTKDPEPEGDVYELHKLSLIDLVFKSDLVTAIILTVLRPPKNPSSESAPDSSKGSFFTIWAERTLGTEVAEQRTVKPIWVLQQT